MKHKLAKIALLGGLLLTLPLQVEADDFGVVLRNILGQSDTAFVTYEKYNSYANVYSTFNSQTFDFTLSGGKQRMAFTPHKMPDVGVGVGRGFIALSYSKSVDDIFHKGDTRNSQFVFNIIANRFGLQFFNRKVKGASTITSSSGFQQYDITDEAFYNKPYMPEVGEEGGTDINLTGKKYEGFNSRETGIDFYYVFNFKNFSYKAAYANSTRQRHSAGSVMTGVNYAYFKSSLNLLADPFWDEADYAAFSKGENVDNFFYVPCESSQMELKYHKLSIKVGYSYNWAICQNLVLNGTLFPLLSMRWSDIKDVRHPKDGTLVVTDFDRNLSVDLMGQASLQWNNGKYYAGISGAFNTFHINRPLISMSKLYIETRVCAGVYFNTFVKKKKNKKK